MGLNSKKRNTGAAAGGGRRHGLHYPRGCLTADHFATRSSYCISPLTTHLVLIGERGPAPDRFPVRHDAIGRLDIYRSGERSDGFFFAFLFLWSIPSQTENVNRQGEHREPEDLFHQRQTTAH